MNRRTQVFNIPFCNYSEQRLFQESCDLLEEPALYTVFFVAAEQCVQLAEAKKLLQRTEKILWVPGDDAVRSLFPKRDRFAGTTGSVQGYVMKLCGYATDMGLDICVLGENQKELDMIMDAIRKTFPYIAIHGINGEQMHSSEQMVNEINAIAPEILIVCLQASEMKHYLEQERKKTNTRLCVCVGGLLMDEMSKKNKLFHTITMSRVLKKRLHKYSKKEQKKNEAVEQI
ncbi:MAG: WecB/TagA/CpsF family glycosyltransferase [Clostridium sp.]|nr:WecB/TagA/CpsF family glycosyltransferase [Clostridium sp.]